jgi:hypothetical protein
LIIDASADAGLGLNHEEARVAWSADGGRTWQGPLGVSTPGDRPIYAAPALSPAGDRAYVVYEAVTSPWRGSDETASRPYHGVLMTSALTDGRPVGWTTAYDGPLGDLRASFPGHRLREERVGDYVMPRRVVSTALASGSTPAMRGCARQSKTGGPHRSQPVSS